MTQLPKLVRDKIPELIKARGAEPQIRLLDRETHYFRLIDKLREETTEFEEKPCVEELADVYEVLRALAFILNISFDEVERERERKERERGGFRKGILLEDIKDAVES